MASAQTPSGWIWVRRLTFLLALSIAIAYPILYLYFAQQGQQRPDLLLDAALGALAAWFLWRVSRAPVQRPNACPACTGRLRRTRAPSGARYWTCSACGYERARDQPRGQERSPSA